MNDQELNNHYLNSKEQNGQNMVSPDAGNQELDNMNAVNGPVKKPVRKKKWPYVLLILLGCFMICAAGAVYQSIRQQNIQRKNKEYLEQQRQTNEFAQSSQGLFSQTMQENGGIISGLQKEKSGEKQLLMVYMVGSNLESEAGMGTWDLLEMAESSFDQNNLTVLVCVGGAAEWFIEELPTDKCTVLKVYADGFESVHTLNNTNMSLPETLTEFIDYGYENYEADVYNMILWNHGGGAILGYGMDENYDNSSMSMNDLRQAISESTLIKAENKFEWVGFDACLMGMLEVANTLELYANYMIASEEIEGGAGWNYSFLKEISEGQIHQGNMAAIPIIDSYKIACEESKYVSDYTMSCVDLSKINLVMECLDAFVAKTQSDLQEGAYTPIARVRESAKTFGRIEEDSFYDTIDLFDLAKGMELLHPQEAQSLMQALEEMIVYEASNIPEAHGLAIYFPYENTEYAELWLSEYGNIGFSEGYVSFVSDFVYALNSDMLPEYDIRGLRPEKNEVSGDYSVQLPKELVDNFLAGKYFLFEEQEIEGENYGVWYLTSYDVSLTEEGRLQSGFDGKLFYLGDTSGNSVQCYAHEIEHTDSYCKYVIPIMGNRIDWDVEADKWILTGYVHVKVDEKNPEGKIIGIYRELDIESTLFPDRNQMELEQGDIIQTMMFPKKITYHEDGSLAPFDQWEDSSTVFLEEFELSGELTVEMKPQEEHNRYDCAFAVWDTQRNSFYTEVVALEP